MLGTCLQKLGEARDQSVAAVAVFTRNLSIKFASLQKSKYAEVLVTVERIVTMYKGVPVIANSLRTLGLLHSTISAIIITMYIFYFFRLHRHAGHVRTQGAAAPPPLEKCVQRNIRAAWGDDGTAGAWSLRAW